MLKIKDEHEIEGREIKAVRNYVIMGLPFFNRNQKMQEFNDAVSKMIESI